MGPPPEPFIIITGIILLFLAILIFAGITILYIAAKAASEASCKSAGDTT